MNAMVTFDDGVFNLALVLLCIIIFLIALAAYKMGVEVGRDDWWSRQAHDDCPKEGRDGRGR